MNAAPIALGAVPTADGGCRFRVWAPLAETVAVHLLSPQERVLPLAREAHGYHGGVFANVAPGARYRFRLGPDLERPDPASRLQPEGVHGPSAVVGRHFAWTDADWRGLPLAEMIFYELHVGTFTPAGTFESAIARLDDLAALGVTAVELMPVAQLPGGRNWGYDGVYPFAAQAPYGGPQGLKHLVDACHARGMAAVLDVVYNHLGPEGNYFADYGPYFAQHYRTPRGAPLNFDGPDSDPVRRYFIENARYWVTDCHIDALRLDAVHAILDFSARPFLQELAEVIAEQAARLGRQVHLIAESALNDTRLIRSRELGGYGLAAQWSDDLHHALHAVITGERQGYYCDFGGFDQLLKALREGFVYSGEYSEYRRRRHGNSAAGVPPERLVVFAQNHDQVGNRMHGDRLGASVPFEAVKMAAGIVLPSPYLPLIFMGEEYGETAPFPYFISHSDPGLVEAVRRGRRAEFAAFGWPGEPPDPQDEGTFASARLDHELRRAPGRHRCLWEYYRHLIGWRKRINAAKDSGRARWEFSGLPRQRVGWLHRAGAAGDVFLLFHAADAAVNVPVPLPAGRWRREIDSREARWGGGGGTG
jgi:maltooligosyltrehalose trehalohydrolase